MDNLERVKAAFAEVFGLEIAEVKEGFSKETVDEWDSIHQLNLISVLEESFGIMFDPEDVVELTSYDNGVEILKKYGVEV